MPKVNGIFVSALNKSIVDKNDANDILIRGKKTFYGGLQTDKFNVSIFIILLCNNILCERTSF